MVIKVLPPEFASDVSEARFKQEIELAAHLQHPNILQVLAAGAKDDLLYYVMPFVSGESLRHRLTREGKLPVADAVRILSEVADALAYAHAEGVIHRDVKPENILLLGTHAVLTDFGVARALTEARSGGRLTDTGISVGTPAYMAPEQVAGGRHIDARADVYALAVVGYEMLAGVAPFAGPTPQAVIAAHVTGTPKPLTAVRSDTPPEVADAIARALAKDPAARLQTAAEFRDTVTASAAAAAGRTGHPLRVAGVYTLVGVALLGVAYFLTVQLGLPSWVVSGAALLLLVGLPIMVVTGLVERRRAMAHVPGAQVQAAGVQGWLTWRKALTGGGLAFGALGVATAVYMLTVSLRPASSKPVSPTAFAVLPFHVAGPNLAFWREGMVDLFSIDLDGASGLRAIPARTVLSRWRRLLGAEAESPDQEAALGVAKSVGARYGLVGSVVGLPSGVRLSAEIYDLQTGAHQPTAQAEGPADSIPALVDRLSIALLQGGLVRGAAAPPALDLRRITTRSLPALKAYLDGEQQFRRAHPREAIDDFKRAVEADSTFALALYRLSLAQGWIYSPHRWGPVDTTYDHLVARFANRLAERDRLLMLGNAQLDKSDPKAVATLEELTRLYPGDVDGWFLLADAYFHLGGALLLPRDQFRSASRRALELDPGFAPGYVHVVEDAFDRLDSSDARRLVDQVREIDQSSPKAVGFGLAYGLVWGTDAEKRAATAALDTASADALLAAKHATNFTPDLWRQTVQTAGALVQQSRHPQQDRLSAAGGRSLAYALRGRLRDARRANRAGYVTITGHEPDEATLAVWGPLFWVRGYPDSAGLGRALRQLASDTSLFAHYFIGAAMAREERWAETARERRWLDSAGQQAMARHDTLAARNIAAYSQGVPGFEAASRGDRRTAIRELAAADSGLGATGDRQSTIVATLERLLVDAGEFRRAERYLTAIDFQISTIRVPGEFYLGRVYEALGDKEGAKLHYGNFVRWWQDSDPELRPWWEQGREALARLSQEPRSP